jgi:hypothetical protein
VQSILRISAVGAILLLGATCVSALEGNFNQPRYKNGSRLDVCFTFGRECGQPPADLFCKVHGYERAANFETEHARPTAMGGTEEAAMPIFVRRSRGSAVLRLGRSPARASVGLNESMISGPSSTNAGSRP